MVLDRCWVKVLCWHFYPTDSCSSCSCCAYFSLNILFTGIIVLTMLKKTSKPHCLQFYTVPFCDGQGLLKVSFYISYRLGPVCIADGLSQVIKTFCDMLHSAADNPVLKWEVWVKKKKKKQLSNNCFGYTLVFSLKTVNDASACLATRLAGSKPAFFFFLWLS